MTNAGDGFRHPVKKPKGGELTEAEVNGAAAAEVDDDAEREPCEEGAGTESGSTRRPSIQLSRSPLRSSIGWKRSAQDPYLGTQGRPAAVTTISTTRPRGSRVAAKWTASAMAPMSASAS